MSDKRRSGRVRPPRVDKVRQFVNSRAEKAAAKAKRGRKAAKAAADDRRQVGTGGAAPSAGAVADGRAESKEGKTAVAEGSGLDFALAEAGAGISSSSKSKSVSLTSQHRSRSGGGAGGGGGSSDGAEGDSSDDGDTSGAAGDERAPRERASSSSDSDASSSSDSPGSSRIDLLHGVYGRLERRMGPLQAWVESNAALHTADNKRNLGELRALAFTMDSLRRYKLEFAVRFPRPAKDALRCLGNRFGGVLQAALGNGWQVADQSQFWVADDASKQSELQRAFKQVNARNKVKAQAAAVGSSGGKSRRTGKTGKGGAAASAGLAVPSAQPKKK